MDSTGKISKFCAVDLESFYVLIYKAFINPNTKELRLIGRVCGSEADNASGIPGITIMISSKTEGRITNLNVISESTYTENNINNDGFFDIGIKVAQNESLFFYNPSFFLKEYKISKLFRY